MTLWTIGHSTKPIDEFVALLTSHGVTRLVDVRTIPRSLHNPQFGADALAKRLQQSGITYLHQPDLGGLRKAKKDSVNAGWRNANFRGYADYMQTEQFSAALSRLIIGSRDMPTAIMCAEAVPWRCHRSLVADALTVHGWIVLHIMTKTKAEPHRLTPFAVVNGHRIMYPAFASSA